MMHQQQRWEAHAGVIPRDYDALKPFQQGEVLADGVVGGGGGFDGGLELGVAVEAGPGHDGLFAGFFDEPKGADVQDSEGTDFFYFIPENEMDALSEMNAESADADGPAGRFLEQPGKYETAEKEGRQPEQILQREK
jgi:hypothetical protein